jgi:AcrR family transcriptional regulator
MTRRGRDTRVRILAEARSALIDGGPASLTLRGVAARVGVSLSNLQFYFANIDALLSGVLDAEIERSAQVIAEAPTSDDTTAAAIEVLLGQHYDRDAVKLFFSLWAFSAGRPAVARVLRRFYERFVANVVAHLRTQEASHQADELETRAWLFVALLEGASVLRALGRRDDKSHDAALRAALARVLFK